ncbi:hypothetical protein BAUCODRAFT_71237 [Baudoinia panamericana UAMH 10762]|uniref:Diaminopimelate epimerase-like protein n=1 Tax=Baudoinia panamericana (strain UAMH 10762) TaxID=717646 RepID=M2MGD0_BAUPA|nr:uncharacterized protein BAUCODRAFT_71237 [Baudoinia panamericana UAMH 10762]EMC95686.1 hypothetical protein BAUCODRAFT_71237 [Baudoinia panamericana UAMH 10762]
MAILAFVTLDVFTETRFAGNPLAVVNVPSGHDVTSEQMQLIAREFNLSETVFIHERHDGDDGVPQWRVRIFIVDAELPFAGHPTIGTAVYALGTLAGGTDRGRLLCNAGPIDLQMHERVVRANIPHNVHVHTENAISAEDIFKLQPALREHGPPKGIDLVSPVKGMTFICAKLGSLEALAAVEARGIAANPKLDQGWDTGFVGTYFYCMQSPDANTRHIRTRMIESTMEDPATGSAACGLGALLTLKTRQKTVKFVITQGVEMRRKSDIGVTVTLKDGLDAVEEIELSGSAVQVMSGHVDLK